MIRLSRFVAVGLGAIILLWQAGNAAAGRFVHPYLVLDVIVAVMLITSIAFSDERLAALWMMVAFTATAAVFAAATWSAIVRDGYSLGRLMTGVGLVPCLACVVVLAGTLWVRPRRAV